MMKLTVGRGHRAATTVARRLAHVPAAAAGRLRVDDKLKAFVDDELLPGTGVAPSKFWDGLSSILEDMAPRNRALLDRRDELQAQLDAWHRANPGTPDPTAYAALLESSGYLAPAAPPFEVCSQHVDPELALVAGPQLVCPVDNARFIVNAANARWGSLLDAIYGTDVLPGDRAGAYKPERGAAAFGVAHSLLDERFPLEGEATWSDVTALSVAMRDGGAASLQLSLASGGEASLRDGAQFVGFLPGVPTARSVLLGKNGLHVELQVDRSHRIGATHAAGIKDVQVESALSAICDMEDSACTVDAADKIVAYGNWLGLMRGELSVPMSKGGKEVLREMNGDRTWTSAAGPGSVTLPGRALLLCRNVGLHMYTDAVMLGSEEVPEGIVDAMVTAAAAMHDLQGNSRVTNSKTGSVYIVKPKMHGPEEGAFTAELFSRVEGELGLPLHTLKVGVMDEERRTSLNLRQMMAATKERLFFINTGFLDRTGDEIHTSMEAGPMMLKADLKGAPWYSNYEESNVDCGVALKLVGKGQIGKGMWAAPDDMAKMVRDKGAQLAAGASTAWVPSPTAATLHALHYHATSVKEVQGGMAARAAEIASRASSQAAGLMTIPLLPAGGKSLSADAIQRDLDNNAQGLLGYVVRWVGQGVGCSKVPDFDNVQLMEDRATLRISSQHIANWLHHGVVNEEQVLETVKRMAAVVDKQNLGERGYKPLAPSFDGPEWHAALELIFKGRDIPNGYTEETLSRWRRVRKAMEEVEEVEQLFSKDAGGGKDELKKPAPEVQISPSPPPRPHA
jgi:malate synthase